MKIFRTIAFCWPEQTSFATGVLKVCNNYSLSLGAITLQTVRHASSTWSKHRDFSFAAASSHFFDSLTETGLPFCSMSEAILVIASLHKHIGFFFHLMSHSLTKPAQESMWSPGYIFRRLQLVKKHIADFASSLAFLKSQNQARQSVIDNIYHRR